MLTKSQFKDILVNNLNHTYMYSFQLFLTRLISRNVHGGGINQYRIKNLTTDTYITTLDEFIAAIDHNSLSLSYDFFNNYGRSIESPHPFFVTLDNFKVELTKYSDEDDVYFELYGDKVKTIMFIMNYLCDLDNLLPLKIIDVKLI